MPKLDKRPGFRNNFWRMWSHNQDSRLKLKSSILARRGTVFGTGQKLKRNLFFQKQHPRHLSKRRSKGFFFGFYCPFFFIFLGCLPILAKLGLRDENIGRDLHFAPVDGPRTFLKKYVWSRYYWNSGFSIIDGFFELFMASPAQTTIPTSFGPIWSLYFRSQYLSLSRFCQFYAMFSAAVLKKKSFRAPPSSFPNLILWWDHGIRPKPDHNQPIRA